MPWLSELLDWLGTRNLTLLADSLISRDQANNAFSTVHQFVILAFVCLFGAPAIFQCLLVGCLPCWICCLLPGWHDHTLQHLGWAYAAGSCSAGVLVAVWSHYQPKEVCRERCSIWITTFAAGKCTLQPAHRWRSKRGTSVFGVSCLLWGGLSQTSQAPLTHPERCLTSGPMGGLVPDGIWEGETPQPSFSLLSCRPVLQTKA